MRGRLRQIVFLTDGAISNESQFLAEIGARLGRSRLFTVGIGSAPNGYFMRKAAEAGRGSFTYIGSAHEVSARVSKLFQKLGRPVLIDVLTSWTTSAGDGVAVEAYPNLIPDLYDGEPVVVIARLDRIGTFQPTAHAALTVDDPCNRAVAILRGLNARMGCLKFLDPLHIALPPEKQPV